MRRGVWLVPALVFCGVLGVYVATLGPYVSGGDSGELAAAACASGVPHPPGYPLFVLLEKMMLLVPWGTPIERLNLLSALCGAGAAAGVAAFALMVEIPVAAAVLAAGLYASADQVWRFAVSSEVFALNALLVIGALIAAVKATEKDLAEVGLDALDPGALTGSKPSAKPDGTKSWTGSKVWQVFCGGVLGLGVCHHQTILAVAGPVALWVVLLGERTQRLARVKRLLLGSLVGLLPLLYLPWAASTSWLYSWGDVSTLSGFLTHVLRREYGTWQLVPGDVQTHYGQNLAAFISYMWHATYGLAPTLAGVGVVAAVRAARQRREWLWLLIAFCCFGYVVGFHALANVDLSWSTHRLVLTRFWILPQLLLALLAARGAAAMIAAMTWGMRGVAAGSGLRHGSPGQASSGAGRRDASGLPVAAVASRRLQDSLLLIAALAAVVALFTLGFKRNDKSQAATSDRFARASLEILPTGTLALLRGDLALPMVYLQSCEHVRPDLLLVNRSAFQAPWLRERLARLAPKIRVPAGLYQPEGPRAQGDYDLAALLDANLDRLPVALQTFRADLSEYTQAESWNDRFRVIPWGTMMLIERATATPDWPWYLNASRIALDQCDSVAFTHHAADSNDAWDELMATEVTDAAYLRGAYLAVASNQSPAVAPIARQALIEAVSWPHQDAARIWKAVGYTYEAEAAGNPAIWPLAAVAWKKYLSVSTSDDAERSTIAALVDRIETAK